MTRLARKRLSSLLDSIKMTPMRCSELAKEDSEQPAGNATRAREVASVTMTISPPKKMKLPALTVSEKEMPQDKSIEPIDAEKSVNNQNFAC